MYFPFTKKAWQPGSCIMTMTPVGLAEAPEATASPVTVAAIAAITFISPSLLVEGSFLSRSASARWPSPTSGGTRSHAQEELRNLMGRKSGDCDCVAERPAQRESASAPAEASSGRVKASVFLDLGQELVYLVRGVDLHEPLARPTPFPPSHPLARYRAGRDQCGRRLRGESDDPDGRDSTEPVGR